MAGHSKWAQIKRQKGASDSKRAQVFGKMARMISAQVKVAKGDRDAVAVKSLIDKARSIDMPVDTIERAISKATETKDLENVTYEAYGPGGVGLIIFALTDSRNRAAQDIRHILDKNGCSLGAIGSVMWAFKKENGELVPTMTTPISESDAEALSKLVDELENLDDVSEIVTNAE